MVSAGTPYLLLERLRTYTETRSANGQNITDSQARPNEEFWTAALALTPTFALMGYVASLAYFWMVLDSLTEAVLKSIVTVFAATVGVAICGAPVGIFYLLRAPDRTI